MQLTEAEIERLRRSGIRLDAEGRFWHEGGEVLHAGLRAALWRWLDRNPDGRWVFRLDERRFVYLDLDPACGDAPLLVRSLRWEGERPIGVLSDGSEEEIDPATIRVDGARATCRVRGGKFGARLSSAAVATLGERVDERGGAMFLRVGGREIRIA